jgi:energy-coupling factor transport system substrate-specific component
MRHSSLKPISREPKLPQETNRLKLAWRGVDLITLAMLAAALGVAFWGYDSYLYPLVTALTTVFPPVAELQLGVWILPAVVGAVLVRKPGAALFAELIAANVELLLGNTWGATVLISASLQALGIELIVLLFAYKRFNLWIAMLGGALSALLEAIYEFYSYVPDYSAGFKAVYLVCGVVSGAVIAGAGGWFLVRALGATGALNAFAAGRDSRTAKLSA